MKIVWRFFVPKIIYSVVGVFVHNVTGVRFFVLGLHRLAKWARDIGTVNHWLGYTSTSYLMGYGKVILFLIS